MTEFFLDLLKIVLPAGLVLYGMFLTVSQFLRKQFETGLVELRNKNAEITLPLRVQAYERMSLYLERIAPNNLIIRTNNPAFTVAALQQVLNSEIREEFAHNYAQQIYMSDNAWGLIRACTEDIIGIINQSAQNLDPSAPGIELAKSIFQTLLMRELDPTAKAMKFLKDEIRTIF